MPSFLGDFETAKQGQTFTMYRKGTNRFRAFIGVGFRRRVNLGLNIFQKFRIELRSPADAQEHSIAMLTVSGLYCAAFWQGTRQYRGIQSFELVRIRAATEPRTGFQQLPSSDRRTVIGAQPSSIPTRLSGAAGAGESGRTAAA